METEEREPSMRFLVAINGSKDSDSAFWTCIRMMNKERDKVWILHCIPYPIPIVDYWAHFSAIQHYPQVENEVKIRSKALLDRYENLCKEDLHIQFESLLLFSNHIGKTICQVVEQHQIDSLYLGKPQKGKLKTLFLPSTSGYCADHANSNIVLVKGDYEVTETHIPHHEVILMEEIERQERMKQYFNQEEHVPLSSIILEEELERNRRIREGLRDSRLADYMILLGHNGNEYLPRQILDLIYNGKIYQPRLRDHSFLKVHPHKTSSSLFSSPLINEGENVPKGTSERIHSWKELKYKGRAQ